MVVYPHPNLPLFPKGLIPLTRDLALTDQHSAQVLLSDQLARDMSPGDLAAGIAYSTSLAQTICRSTQHRVRLRQVRMAIPSSIRISDLKLTERALAALQTRICFAGSDAWRTANAHEFVTLPAGGRSKLKPLGAKLLLAFLLAAEHAIENGNRLATEPNNVEAELTEILDRVLYSTRTKYVFTRANGWDGKRPSTIADLSDQFAVSTQRIRQILIDADVAIAQIALSKPHLRHLRWALAELAAASPLEHEAGERLLTTSRITRENFRIEGLLNAAKKLNCKVPIRITHRNGVRRIERQAP